jgi:uncharacterized protein
VAVDVNPVSYSPSDLSAYLACRHLAGLELSVKRGELVEPMREDPQGDLIRRKGEEHEARYLESLRAAGREIVEIDFRSDYNFSRAAADTVAAIRGGADVVYQAVFVDGDWRGFADFVERRPDGSYEVADTKLARHAKPSHIFQLCFYSIVLGGIQGEMPTEMHLVLGDGRRESFRVADYDAYYRRIRDEFRCDADAGFADSRPIPCGHCGICSWSDVCEQRWDHEDSPFLVAGITRKQVERLEAAGVTTLAQLSQRVDPVEKLAGDQLAKLREQAELQHYSRSNEGKLLHRLLETDEQHGFGLLPEPDEGDVYFDIEGDPFYSPDGSLEYLFGVTYCENGQRRFTAFWARDESEEKHAFEQLVSWIVERRVRYPKLHVYHYANYERAALQRLMQKHGTCEDAIDNLLRGHVLVDLYQVVRQGLRLSLPSYSLKKVEAFYFPERQTEVVGGDESTVVFERFLETGDEELLKGIEAYNKDDCDSTLMLHEWLLDLRPHHLPWAQPPPERETSDEAREAQAEREVVQAVLRRCGEALLADLLDFHRRDAKPAWWDYFRRLTMDEPELREDSEAIGGIECDGQIVREEKQSYVYRLTFPPQEFKVGSDGVDPETEGSPGTILSIDGETGEIELKRGKKRHGESFPKALVPGKPLPTTVQRQALLRIAKAVVAHKGDYAAARSILAREAPRADLSSLESAVLTADRSHVFVQGPPGSGKTWRGAAAAVSLVAKGKKIGIVSQSHKAIHKFLDDFVEHADKRGVEFTAAKKTSGYAGTEYVGDDRVANVANNKAAASADVQVLAGTSWFFSRDDVHVDTLFIDEAGQTSLADALAVSGCAENVVLLGDPNQLPQVSQGAQPREVRASVLEHLLGDELTVPPDRGVFLAETWRLRPEICSFISGTFYEGRLHPVDVCMARSLELGNGLRFIPVQHTNNRQTSVEEAATIRAEIERLLGSRFTDGNGRTRSIGYDDILVVTPYNMQVRCLRATLPRDVAVGTVDKFQGQQAPIVFFSMASSSGDNLPRGIEFLFSPNRFNVAVSRAQCLAYVVASPRLLVADAATPAQMRLVNIMCRFAEAAT